MLHEYVILIPGKWLMWSFAPTLHLCNIHGWASMPPAAHGTQPLSNKKTVRPSWEHVISTADIYVPITTNQMSYKIPLNWTTIFLWFSYGCPIIQTATALTTHHPSLCQASAVFSRQRTASSSKAWSNSAMRFLSQLLSAQRDGNQIWLIYGLYIYIYIVYIYGFIMLP